MSTPVMTNNKRKGEDDDNEKDSTFHYYKKILMADLDSESEPTNDNVKWFLCRTCRRWSNSKRGLASHYWHMHGQNVSLSSIKEFSDDEHPVKQPVKKSAKHHVRSRARHDTSDQKDEVFRCDVCLEVCASALKLLVHKRLHIGRARIYCTMCNITFEKRIDLLKHVKMRHSDQRPN